MLRVKVNPEIESNIPSRKGKTHLCNNFDRDLQRLFDEVIMGKI